MSTESEMFPRAEEVLRLLASATGTARLYPPASVLPATAAEKFTHRANEVMSAQGPLRYVVGPDGFRIGDQQLAVGNSQVAALAKQLHALQVGQVVIAPGLTEPESAAFVIVANADATSVRRHGGARALLATGRVTHIAVVEVSLRASNEEGLLGVDLTTAPLDEIAEEIVGAAERWARAEGAGDDEMATAISRLEDATRGIAVERSAAALMRLDEATRMKVLAYSLKADANGSRMDGMLGVIAQMKPAALARLLKLVALQAGTEPLRIVGAFELPPETAKLLAEMLAPMPEDDFVADDPLYPMPAETPPAAELARDMVEPADAEQIQRDVAAAKPALASQRALGTAVALSGTHPDAETVRAIGDSLPQAARDGAFETVRLALRRLDELASQPELIGEVNDARGALSDPAVLADVCIAVRSEADGAIAGEILQAAGPSGAEALLDAYVRGDEPQRSLLRPVMRGMSEPVLGVARGQLRTAEPKRAVAILRSLAALGDRRTTVVMTQGLSHLDEQVRFAAITALADTPDPEAAAALVKALGHPEPETQRFAVREIGRVKAAPAIHQLTRALEDISARRTHETKREVIRALQHIGTPEAERALHRTADRTFVLTRRSRQLRTEAREALRQIDLDRASKGADAP